MQDRWKSTDGRARASPIWYSPQPGVGAMKRILREPLLHFVLLGAALFALRAWRGEDEGNEEAAA